MRWLRQLLFPRVGKMKFPRSPVSKSDRLAWEYFKALGLAIQQRTLFVWVSLCLLALNIFQMAN